MPPEPTTSPPPRQELLTDRLDSWKEIATFLGRGVRTVQRWEREERLPVHRLPHDKRGTVFAYREELAAWWESRRRTIADAAESTDDEQERPRSSGSGAPPHVPIDPEAAIPASRRSPVLPAASALLTLAVLFSVAAVYVLRTDGSRAGAAVVRTERVTNVGWNIYWPALSNDGVRLAFASDGGHDGAPLQIWVAERGGAPRQVTECT